MNTLALARASSTLSLVRGRGGPRDGRRPARGAPAPPPLRTLNWGDGGVRRAWQLPKASANLECVRAKRPSAAAGDDGPECALLWYWRARAAR